MVTIGNDTLPGTTMTLESSVSAGVSLGSAGIPVITGQAYLQGNADASANTVRRITRYREAATEFGARENSQLTRAVQDALSEGAYPVFAIAPEETEVTSEDLSGVSGQSGTLANAPVQENADDISFTINSTAKDTVLHRDGDPEDASPDADEVLLNPVTGKYHADEALGNTGDEVDYWYVDYADTFDEIDDHVIAATNDLLRDVVDFVGLTDETDDVVNDLEAGVDDMESNGGLTIGIAGAGDPYIEDTSNYSNPFDTSRMQLVYPSRDADGNTLIGSYVGARARVGIDSTPIFKNLQTQSDLQFNLTTAQQENLVTAKVNPIEQRSGPSRIIEDLTTVDDSNADEQAWTQGSARLITDFVAESVDAASAPFVGQFHNITVQNSIQGNVSSELNALLESQQLDAYNLTIEEEDSKTLIVDVGIDAADPLRNIDLTVSAGNVANGVTVAGE